jgi:fengycin family lipopeptide synthetase B
VQKTTERSGVKQSRRGSSRASAIPQCPREVPVPLSFGQHQMWLQLHLLSDSPAAHESAIVHLPGPLDAAALERSLNEILRRHEAWRTSFPVVNGRAVQLIHPTLSLTLPVVDLCHLPEAERLSEALRLAREEASMPFDRANGPLLRATLVHLGDRRHQLHLTLHHLICDGNTLFRIFLQELHALYEAFSTGQPSPLPELPIQYADFALWQWERLQGGALADQLAYWKQQLAGATGHLELPADHPRPAVRTNRGKVALETLSRCEGVTLFMTLAAAFNTLLHRYTGQVDLLIGTSIALRKHPEAERLLGFFSDTLVLRTNVSGNLTFRELLARVRDVILQAEAHREVPFEYLVRELQPERESGQDPLFQVMLTLQPSLPSLPSGWTLTQGKTGTGLSECDLSLIFEDRPEGLVGRFEYSSDLFGEPTIARMAGHWQTLLESIVGDPEQRLSELQLLTGTERHQLLVEWNATRAPYPVDKCIHQLFEEQVGRTPDAVAVVFEGEQLTYQELNRRANQLAHYLQCLGVGPDVLVSICVERSLEMVVGLLGILKAGGAYVPLDPAYPKDRLAFMLADTQAPVLITQQQLVAKLPEYGGHLVCMQTDREEIARESEENPDSGVTDECLAYVIYTSGSTGKPKGVSVTHANVVRLFEATDSWFHFNNRDVWTLFHSYAFDFSVWELWGALLYGGRLVVVSYWVSRSPEMFFNLLRTEQVTVLNQTPSAFYQLIRVQGPSSTAQDLALRLVIFGGETLEFQSLKPWFDRYGDKSPQLVNMYGITETTVHVTYYPLSAADLELTSSSIIGRAIPDLQVYILDPYLQPVPIGVPGEMYVGGAGLARGYLNRPQLTAERFISNPFSQEPGARLYKTGDLARYLPDGTIEYLGRIDHQVKIRGYRIELGEIEAALNQHPAVHQAVVLARADVPGDKRLVAYVMLHKDQSTSVDELKSHTMKLVPDYMVPSAFVWLEGLPLTPNGKVDRRALPAPDPVRQVMDEPFVAPASLIHHQLKQIWEDLLEVRPIGIRDNFFYLGGHSLLAARLITEIERVLGKKLSFATLFAGPTIEQLAQAMQTEEERSSRIPLVAVQASGSSRPFFYLHGAWESDAFYCFHLARHLGPDQPFYTLAPYNFDGLRVPLTIEEMAAAHLQSLRAVQPEGPYLLGGFCNGGLVAYEMARQLRAAGQRVDLLVLIVPAYPPMLHMLVRGVIRGLGKILRLSQEQQLQCFLRLRHMYKYVLRQRKLEDLKAFRHIDPSILTFVPTADALRQDDNALLDWVVTDYGYAQYPGKLKLLWAREERFSRTWRRKVAHEKDIELHFIPGTHIGCRTDHIQAFAEELGRCISEAQATELR